jgi:hypothetical protein
MVSTLNPARAAPQDPAMRRSPAPVGLATTTVDGPCGVDSGHCVMVAVRRLCGWAGLGASRGSRWLIGVRRSYAGGCALASRRSRVRRVGVRHGRGEAVVWVGGVGCLTVITVVDRGEAVVRGWLRARLTAITRLGIRVAVRSGWSCVQGGHALRVVMRSG